MYSGVSKTYLIAVLIAGASAVPRSLPNVLDTRADEWAGQNSTLDIYVYAQENCAPTAVGTSPAIYGHDHRPGNFSSYWFSRSLATGEHLDLSTYSGTANNNGVDKACASYVGSLYAGSAAAKARTCLTWPNLSCFRVWHS